MPQNPSSGRHPFLSLILLFSLFIGGTLLFGIIGLAVGAAMYTVNVFSPAALTGSTPASLGLLKVVQIFSGIGSFILPSVVFAGLESDRPADFLKSSRRIPLFGGILAILLCFVSAPLLELCITLNKNLDLPGALQGLENWMRREEDKLAELTKQLLTMNSMADLSLNLFMIAFLPAIGEELFFRGCVQQTFQRWFRNPHTAIWVTAIVFSAIHMQFFGFLPRMLLGALLGYLFYWGKSIWLPILAHFTNNAGTVILAYVNQKNGKAIDDSESFVQGNTVSYLVSALLTGGLLYLYWRSTKTITSPNPQSQDYGTRLD